MKKIIIITLVAGISVVAGLFAQQVLAESTNPLLDWFRVGGFFMYPLLLLSILALAVVVERVVVYWHRGLPRFKQLGEQVQAMLQNGASIPEIISFLEKGKCPGCRILAQGLALHPHGPERVEKSIEAQTRIELAALENRLSILSAIGTTAPLVGFLGTVSGMIESFKAIANAEQVNARIVASGIFEALITTEAGLIVAIPVFFLTNYFYHVVDSFGVRMEKITEDVLNSGLGGPRA